MNLLALDASTKSTGVAVYIDGQLKHHQCITASSTDLIKRIYKMTDRLHQIIKQFKIEKIIMEQVLPDKGPSVKTQKALMYLQAAIQFMKHDDYPKIQIQFIYPSSWRAKCGIHTGRGIKRQTLKQADMAFVQQKFGLRVNDDIADAICIGYSYWNNTPVKYDNCGGFFA